MYKHQTKTPFDILVAPIMFKLTMCACNPKVNNMASKFLWLFLFVSNVIIITFSLVDLYSNVNNLKQFGESFIYLAGLLEVLMIMLILYFKKNTTLIILQVMKEQFWYKEDEIGKAMYDKYARYCKIMSRLFIGYQWFTTINVFFLNLAPIINPETERRFPIEMKFPIYNFIKDSPYYEIIYIIQIIVTNLNAVFVHIQTDLFYYVSLGLVLMQVDVLKSKLKTVSLKNDQKSSYTELYKFITHHNTTLQLTKNIEEVFRYILLMKVFTLIFFFCLAVYLFNKQSDMEMSLYLTATVALSTPLLYCVIGETVINEFESIGKAAYEVGWENVGNKNITSSLALIILRAQKQTVLTAGSIAELRLMNYVSYVKLVYSYILVLKNVDTN